MVRNRNQGPAKRVGRPPVTTAACYSRTPTTCSRRPSSSNGILDIVVKLNHSRLSRPPS